MKKTLQCRITVLLTMLTLLAMLTMLMQPLPAHAGGFDFLSAPEIQSMDPDSMTIIWDEPDKPGNESSPNRNGYDNTVPMDNWSCLGRYALRIYYADHALTAEEWPASPLKVPQTLELVSEQSLGAKDNPTGTINPNWLTKGNGFYYFGIVAYTTGGTYLYNTGNETQVECAYSAIEQEVRVYRTPYELKGISQLPAPGNIIFRNGQLRWSFDWELVSKAKFRMDLYTQEEGHQKGHGLFLNAQRDSTNRELYVDLTGDNAGSLQPGVTYNLALWGESRDYQAYTDSEEVVIENFLAVSGERLAAPGNVIIDENTLEVSWDPVDDPNLLDYQLNVYYSNGQTNPRSVSFKNTRETHASINSDVLDYGNGTYYVTVRARAIDVTKKANGIANPDASGSQAGEDAWNALPHAAITVSDTPLPTISLAGSSWGTDGFLRWDPVEGASSYEVQTYRRTSASEEFKEYAKKTIPSPAFMETTPTTPSQEEIAVRVRAISSNAAEHANGEWSDLSPVYTYSDAPVLPSLKKKFNKEDLTISWELITGEDAAYVGGYVVEIRFSETDSVGNSTSVQPGWTVITEGNTVSSVPLSAFAKYLGSYESAGSATFNVWAYSSDLAARNNGKNNSTTRLPEGVLNALESTPRLTLSDITRKDGRCSFLVSISGNCDGARLFTVVYKSSGMMRRVQALDAEQTVPVTLTGLGQNDRISVILVDENARPLTSVTPVG